MRTHWGSKLGFILATAGSAIGLGNIWRFPYLAGKYGGGIFLLAYLVCVITLGYFLLTAKLAFGRGAQTNIIDGFKAIAKPKGIKVSPFWGYIGGALTCLNVLLVASVYVIVIGWTASYVKEGASLWLGLTNQSIDADLFQRLTSSFSKQLFWSIFCILITSLVIIRGVKKGIERVSLYLMPILFFLLLFMVIWMIFLPGSEKGIIFFLQPNWEQIGFTPLGFRPDRFCDLILTAFGQAIYSLSLGLGVAFIYGSYLPKETDIKKSVRWIVLLDTLVAFLSGLIVLPAVFAFGLQPNQGPALSFISLPLIFSKMAAGHFLMFLFFILLFLAALTSLISIYEALVSLLSDKLSISRPKATALMAFLNILFAGIVLLSSTKIWTVHIAGMDLFDFVDKVTGSFSMALLILVCCLFMGWKVYPAIESNLGGKHTPLSRLFNIYLKWVLRVIAPVIIILLFIAALI